MKRRLFIGGLFLALLVFSGCEETSEVDIDSFENIMNPPIEWSVDEITSEGSVDEITFERAESLRRGLIKPETPQEEAIINCISDEFCSNIFPDHPFCFNGGCVGCKTDKDCEDEGFCYENDKCVECYLNDHCKEGILDLECVIDYNMHKCIEVPKIIELMYTTEEVIGERGLIQFEVYRTLNERLNKLDRSIWYYPGEEEPPNEKDYLLKFVSDSQQIIEVKKLASIIRELSDSNQERARIVISLIQMIPYDNDAVNDIFNHVERYPYEVLFDQKGICGEKSRLMLMLLSELGFGTAYILFPGESHAVAGIKCPKEYSFKESGYCFLEATTLTRIGQSDLSYIDIGKLDTIPQIIEVSDGDIYTDVKIRYDHFMKMVEEGDALFVTDRFGNEKIRLSGGTYYDQYNNPNVIISYGDNTVEWIY